MNNSDLKAVMHAVAPYIHELEQRVAALALRVSELERSQKSANPRTDATVAHPRQNGQQHSNPRRL